jgi:hypothetical protein
VVVHITEVKVAAKEEVINPIIPWVVKRQSPRERPRERRPEKLAERHPRNLF